MTDEAESTEKFYKDFFFLLNLNPTFWMKLFFLWMISKSLPFSIFKSVRDFSVAFPPNSFQQANGTRLPAS